jgi:muconolactone D-isomerase
VGGIGATCRFGESSNGRRNRDTWSKNAGPATPPSSILVTAMEFLANMTTHVPDGTPDSEVEDTKVREAVRASELAAQGHLLRLWNPPVVPGEWRTIGLWSADDENELQALLTTWPLHVWMKVDITPLTPKIRAVRRIRGAPVRLNVAAIATGSSSVTVHSVVDEVRRICDASAFQCLP